MPLTDAGRAKDRMAVMVMAVAATVLTAVLVTWPMVKTRSGFNHSGRKFLRRKALVSLTLK